MRHGNLWASSVLHGCVVGTKCVSECTLYRPMVIQPLLHRGSSHRPAEPPGDSLSSPQFITHHSPQRACHSGTVLRASLLSDFHIQRYCQWYGCSMAYFDKGRRGFGNSSKCREKFGASLCFSSANFPANFVSVHFVWRFTANFVSVRGTETGGAQRRAASAKQLHFSSPHWPLVNNGGFLSNEAVKR